MAAWIVLVLQLVAASVPLYSGPPLRHLVLASALGGAGLLTLVLLRFGRLQLASDVLSGGIWAGAAYGVLTGGDLSASYVAFAIAVLFAGLVRGPRVSALVVVGSALVGLAGALLPPFPVLGAATALTPFQGSALRTLLLVGLWGIAVAAGRSVADAVAEVRGAKAERLRSAVSLAVSEERLRAVLEHASDLITVHDQVGHIRYASAAASRLLGYDVSPGFNPLDRGVIHPDCHADVRHAFREAIARRQPQRVELRLRQASGAWLDVESVAAAVEDPDGSTGVVVMTRDISERKRLDGLILQISHGLRSESGEGYLKTLVGRLADGLSVRYSFVAEVLPGHTRARTIAFRGPGGLEPDFEYDLEGAPCHEVLFSDRGLCVYPRDVARQFPLHEGLARRGIHAYAGHPLFAADGAPLGLLVIMDDKPFASSSWVESVLRIFAIRAGAEFERMRAEGRQRHLEEQLRQSQKLETIGQLAGGIAHDFNNLLTPVLGYADILADDIHPTDPRRRQVLFIRDAAEKATALTRQLLSFSRRQVLDLRPVDLNRVVTNFQRILRRTIREHIDIIVQVRARQATIVADESQVEQILMNLAVNAQDAMPMGGTIRMTTSDVELPGAVGAMGDSLDAGPYVVLSVSDNGVGMAEEVQRRIFEPFYTTKEKGQGTGLGLATVYGIVRQHRGTVDVESAPGRGTTFRVYFPITQAGVADTPVPVEEPSPGSERVALVEDDPSVREMTTTVLQRYGYAVTAFDGPDACLREVESGHICAADLLLTDVVMPGLNGRQLYERLVTVCPGLRVLYMSGYPADVISAQGLLDDGIVLLQKPFAPGALLARVRDVLDARE